MTAAPAAPELQVPLAIKFVIAIAIVAAANRVSPGIIQAVLLLVVLYLASTHADEVASLARDASNSLHSILAKPVPETGHGR